MSDEFGELNEREPKSKPKKPMAKMTLDKAVEMGEYDPDFLSTFPEWSGYTNNIRWHYIREALKNRRYFLLKNWAEVNNTLDLRLKPKLKQVLDKINDQIIKVNQDEERLRIEYIK